MSVTRIFKAGLFSILMLLLGFSHVSAANYKIDTQGMHAYIEFKVPHMGFSILGGRFNKFDGSFMWDKDNPSASSVEVTIDTTSIDTNHKMRDDHLKGKDFLNVEKHPTASFKSTKYQGDANGGKLMGAFTLNGVTKNITIDVKKIGEGKDNWGGVRAGFTGTTTLNSADFGYTSAMFPKNIEIALSVEGIQQK